MTQADGKGGSLFDKYLSDPSRRRAAPVDDAPPAPARGAMPAPAPAPTIGDNGGPALEEDPEVYPLRLGERLRGSWYQTNFREMRNSAARRKLPPEVRCYWREAFDLAADENPAGTLPAEEEDLAFLMHLPLEEWRALRAAGALMGWREVLAVSDDGREIEVRLEHPEFTRAIVRSVEMIERKSKDSKRGTAAKQMSLLREKLREVGAPEAFLARADLVERVAKRLADRGEQRRAGHVRAAFLVIQERAEREEAERGGSWRNVASFRRPEGFQNE